MNGSSLSIHPYQYVRPGRKGQRQGGIHGEDWFECETDLINFVRENAGKYPDLPKSLYLSDEEVEKKEKQGITKDVKVNTKNKNKKVIDVVEEEEESEEEENIGSTPAFKSIWGKLTKRKWRYINGSSLSIHPYQYVRPERKGQRQGGIQGEDWFECETDLINFVRENAGKYPDLPKSLYLSDEQVEKKEKMAKTKQEDSAAIAVAANKVSKITEEGDNNNDDDHTVIVIDERGRRCGGY